MILLEAASIAILPHTGTLQVRGLLDPYYEGLLELSTPEYVFVRIDEEPETTIYDGIVG